MTPLKRAMFIAPIYLPGAGEKTVKGCMANDEQTLEIHRVADLNFVRVTNKYGRLEIPLSNIASMETVLT